MLNSPIESAVTESSARRPSEKAASAPAEPATSSRSLSPAHSPRDHNFLSQLEGRKSWWDAVARNAFVSETGRGHKLEFSSWLPLSLPVRPLSQRLRKEKRQTLYSLKGQWNQWGTSTEASTPICSWTRNRTGVQTCHQLKGPELVYKETNFHDGNVGKRFSEHQERRLGGYNVRDSLLMKRATKPVRDQHWGFFSNMFLVMKQDGGSDLSST